MTVMGMNENVLRVQRANNEEPLAVHFFLIFPVNNVTFSSSKRDRQTDRQTDRQRERKWKKKYYKQPIIFQFKSLCENVNSSKKVKSNIILIIQYTYNISCNCV